MIHLHGGAMMANYWQGAFPYGNTLEDGYERTSPVRTYPATPDIAIPRKVLKGGSHLCAATYCQRYRPAARHAQAVDSTTSHICFRCIIRDKKGPRP